MKKQTLMKQYRHNFNDTFEVPDQLEDIKAELTFYPLIMFTTWVKIRLTLELLSAFTFILIAIQYYGLNEGYHLGEHETPTQVYILGSISLLFILCFIIDISDKIIRIIKKKSLER